DLTGAVASFMEGFRSLPVQTRACVCAAIVASLASGASFGRSFQSVSTDEFGLKIGSFAGQQAFLNARWRRLGARIQVFKELDANLQDRDCT
ncbi:hypothetical protein, partial [Bradyrhizobium sp. USDA 3458]|uniref:hypothetical protein n=1 Tax=Bradyrhizobium sp. USDA 3458 TaxID=2591461 RepID=UPI001AEDC0BE